jgi:hypothetical protein
MEVELIAWHGDHCARRRIKIHFIEAVFPEDIPDVLAVAIGWIPPMTESYFYFAGVYQIGEV